MKSIEIVPEQKEQLDKALNSDKPFLLLYRMHGCPHCVSMQDDWKIARTTLAKDNGIYVAEVEYQYINLLPPWLRNIRGFPTIHLIENKQGRTEYQGDRSAPSIVEFAKQYAKKPAAPKKKAADAPTSTQAKKPKAKPKVATKGKKPAGK